jgi:hypothetical protein
MHPIHSFKAAASLLFLPLTLLAGCGGNTSANNASTIPVNSLQTGNWQLGAASAVYAGTSFNISAYISDSNGTVTGVAHVSNSSCYSYSTGVALSGSQDSKGNLTLTSGSISGQILTVTGVVTGSGVQISGLYTVSGGCASGDKGTIGGFVIPDISGTYKGTIVSRTGVQIATTAQIVQTAVDANGFYHFTGSASFTGSPCFTTATLAGSGNSILNGNQYAGYFTTAGSPAAQIALSGLVNSTVGASPTSLLVTSYSVSGGLCSGDTGSGQLNKQ